MRGKKLASAMRADLPLSEVMPKTAARMADASFFPRTYAMAVRSTESVYGLFTGRYAHHLHFSPTRIDAEDNPVVDAVTPSLLDLESWKSRTPTPIDDATPTLAGRLSAAGYDTFTPIAYVFFRPRFGVTRDFRDVAVGPYLQHNRDNQGVTSEALTARALAYLEKARRPYFLWIHYMDPHDPYTPYGDLPADASAYDAYRSELRRVDDALEPLFQALEASGDWGRSVRILAADHGEAFGEHGLAYHGTGIFDEQARVPLHIALPGGAPRTVTEPASLVDLVPTLLDLLGVEAGPAPLDGRSLVPALLGEPLPPRPVFLSASLNGHRIGVVDGVFKYVVDRTAGWQALYDLSADPAESKNLADRAPEVAARLDCLLRASGALGDAP